MTQYYKVLVNGRSCHGGSLQWPMPDGDQPGAWVTVNDDIQICKRGLHATSRPYSWYKAGCTVHPVECGEILDSLDDKIVSNRMRILPAGYTWPEWFQPAVDFIEQEFPAIPWMRPDSYPLLGWKVFPTRDAACNAARNAARDAACNAAWDAAESAALLALCLTVSDLIDPRHLSHAEASMDVWRKGYGLLCDVQGVLYVYEQV